MEPQSAISDPGPSSRGIVTEGPAIGGPTGEERENRRVPFTREIETVPLPAKFKLPNIPPYGSRTDPYDHLDAFNVQMDLQTDDPLVKC